MNRTARVLSESRFLAESLVLIRSAGRPMPQLLGGALVAMIEARLIRGVEPITARMRADIRQLACEPKASQFNEPPWRARYLTRSPGLRAGPSRPARDRHLQVVPIVAERYRPSRLTQKDRSFA